MSELEAKVAALWEYQEGLCDRSRPVEMWHTIRDRHLAGVGKEPVPESPMDWLARALKAEREVARLTRELEQARRNCTMAEMEILWAELSKTKMMSCVVAKADELRRKP